MRLRRNKLSLPLPIPSLVCLSDQCEREDMVPFCYISGPTCVTFNIKIKGAVFCSSTQPDLLLPDLEPLSSSSSLHSRSTPDPLELCHASQPGAVMFPPSQSGADELLTTIPRDTKLPRTAWSRRASSIGAWSSSPTLTISAWSCRLPSVQGLGRRTTFYWPGVAELPVSAGSDELPQISGFWRRV